MSFLQTRDKEKITEQAGHEEGVDKDNEDLQVLGRDKQEWV